MTKRQRLELTWIRKDQRPRLEPRILVEDILQSYHAKQCNSEADIFDNRLIVGDNLLALKALEAEFIGRVKCIYIDPPFNTQQALTHYEDGVEHSIWLSLMRDRLEELHRLLSPDGTLFVHIDDNELGYLIVLLDDIFGRSNRLYVITFKQGSATGHKSINPGCVSTTNFVLIYAKNKPLWKPNRVFTGRDRDTRYGQYIVNIEDDYKNWQFVTLTRAYASAHGLTDKEARKVIKDDPSTIDVFVMENARNVIRTARPDYDGVSEAARKMIDASKGNSKTVLRLERDSHSDMYFKGGERILFYADKLKVVDGRYVAGEPLTTLWDDILSNNLHNEGGVEFPKGKKPEALIKRILELATGTGDWVLDSFAGSGTTGAVAHKMGRRWIMVESGDHAQTHVIPRLKSVINGRDTSGITEAVGWNGGGGFRYYRLAPSLLEKDRFGNWVVAKDYNAPMLAEAMCKLMGFTYAPSQEPADYWRHGHSTERDFIYVTTQALTHDALKKLAEEVGPERTLLICCKAFNAREAAFKTLTLKKIPQAVLTKCEWARDDYSFRVANLPPAPNEKADNLEAVPKRKKNAASGIGTPDLFAAGRDT